MNKQGNWKVAIVGGVASLAVALAVTVRAEEATAKVQQISGGTAQCSEDGNTWQALQKGAVLKQGSSIKTDASGNVDLYLGKNGPYVRVSPDTTMKFNTLTCDKGAGEVVTATELGLDNGKLTAVVRKINSSSRFEIKTASATLKVKGTKVQGSSRGQFAVKDGSSEVFYTPAGETTPTRFDVPSGYTFEPSGNGGKGIVIPTPAELVLDFQQNLNGLMGAPGAQAAAGIWAPTPTWNAPTRPFDPPGQPGHPFNLPPVFNPTTQTGDQGQGGQGPD